ncbi:T-cell receptor beta chain [Pelobates cultripes]|nr:T-cell receptor beta chain [Pelobates cultripes]
MHPSPNEIPEEVNLTTLAGLAQTSTINQWPRTIMRELGSTVHMNCTQTTDHEYMYWYLQRNGQGLELIARYLRDQTPEYENDIYKDRFIMTRTDSAKRTQLEIKSVKNQDEGIYFCASSDAQ